MSLSNLSPHQKQIAIQIMTYWLQHPQAQDTANGIARWWVSAPTNVVTACLEALASAGLVEVCKNVNGNQRYRLHESRLNDFRRFIAEEGN